MTGVSNSFGESTTYTYDSEGKVLTQGNSNGTSTEYEYYEARGWPNKITHKNSGTAFEEYEITYDEGTPTIGDITRVDELSGDYVTYGYDALYRLTSETKTGTDSYSKSYTYDLSGNITDVNGSAFATYDLSNKLSTITGGSATYDADGALTAISGTGVTSGTFTYDILDRLTQQNAGTPYLLYRYDAFSRRIHSAYSTLNSSKKYYVYAGDKLIGEVLHASSGTAAVAYTWGPDGLISKRNLTGTPASYWYHFGPQGETRYLTNSSGTTVNTYKYTAYGVTRGSTGSVINPYRYGGKYGYYNDDLAGLMLARYRWYHPQLGRWMTRDPIDYEGGFNLYEYVGGRVVRFVDPKGTDRIRVFVETVKQLRKALWLSKDEIVDALKRGKNVDVPKKELSRREMEDLAERAWGDAKCDAPHGGRSKHTHFQPAKRGGRMGHLNWIDVFAGIAATGNATEELFNPIYSGDLSPD